MWQRSSVLRSYRLDVCCRSAALQPQQPVLSISVDVVDLMWASQMSRHRAPMQLDQQMIAAAPEPRDQHCRHVQAWLTRSQMPYVLSGSSEGQATSASGSSMSLQGHLTVTDSPLIYEAQVELAALIEDLRPFDDGVLERSQRMYGILPLMGGAWW